MRHLLRLNVTDAAEKRFRMQPLYGDGVYPVPQDLSQLTLRQSVCSWYFNKNAGIQPYRFHGFKEDNFPNGISFTRFRVMKKQWNEGTKNGPDRSALLGHNFVYQETKPHGFYSSYFHQRISS